MTREKYYYLIIKTRLWNMLQCCGYPLMSPNALPETNIADVNSDPLNIAKICGLGQLVMNCSLFADMKISPGETKVKCVFTKNTLAP